MSKRRQRARPRLAVWKFASCDGCQLSLLDCEDELLELGERMELGYFREASSRDSRGPFELSLVDGSITTAEDIVRIHEVRRRSRRLVSIGACATSGGIQALRNFHAIDAFRSVVYPHPEYVATLATSTAIAEHVRVDFELRGCPVNKRQLIEVVSSFLAGRTPTVANDSVCGECKRRQQVCVMVAHGTPCLGPVTQAGCGALCPGYHRGCYGCYGPQQRVNAASLSRWLGETGVAAEDLVRAFRTFNANAPEFRTESLRLESLLPPDPRKGNDD